MVGDGLLVFGVVLGQDVDIFILDEVKQIGDRRPYSLFETDRSPLSRGPHINF